MQNMDYPEGSTAFAEPATRQTDRLLANGHSSSAPPAASVTVSHIYKLSTEQLRNMFPKNEGEAKRLRNPTDELKDHGSTKGVLKRLASEANTGIVGDDKDLRRRRAVFGENTKPLPTIPALWDSVKEQCKDRVWLVVCASALASAICGGLVIGITGVYEGISIILAAFFIIGLTSTADWFKDRRFVQLQSLIRDENVAVIRGKFGATQSVSVWELVVGDVILLETGARVPADCLVVESADLEVTLPVPLGQLDAGDLDEGEELAENFQEALPGKKGPADADDIDTDPFLLADSLIIRGQCKAVVCCVGVNSTRGRVDPPLETNKNTALQKKLENLSGRFTVQGIYVSGVILVILLITLVIQVASSGPNSGVNKIDDGTEDDVDVTTETTDTTTEEDELLTTALTSTEIFFQKLSQDINLVVVLFVVAIPEGLPLTIGISLAFSVMKMYDDRILVRKLHAPERMGGIEEICCGKTATLTKNDMRVAQFYCEARQVKNSRKNTLLHCELSNETIERVKESILYNCEARVEMDATTYVPVGNGTEVALLKFLQDADVPIHHLIQRKLGRIRATSVFSPEKKYSAVAIECPDRPQRVAVYLKGAPEIVTSHCGSIQYTNGIDGLGEDEVESIDTRVTEMAGQPLRVLAFAFVEMDLSEWLALVQTNGTPGAALKELLAASRSNRGGQFTFIGAFGLRDPLRPKVQSCIQYAREKGQLQVRLVSGDHIETATQVARKAGILPPNEYGKTYAVLHAERFREIVGEVGGKDGAPRTVRNMDKFEEVAENLRVLARATAADKHLLVVGLKALGKKVVVTGDGINDVEALKQADVGLSMGSGCSAAKEASDLILTEDDFEASLRAVMWGRNIYHNVSRFLQFQVTVNISVILTIAMGACVFAESPLSAVQLLWVNLIMDTFAAFALATEPPLPSVIQGAPFVDGSSVLSPTVWRQIMGISAWNTLVMGILIFFGKLITGLEYEGSISPSLALPEEWTDSPWSELSEQLDICNNADPDVWPDGWEMSYACASLRSQAKLRHLTYIFNTFVFLQLFNEINCRKVGRRDFNVFEAFFHNAYFLVVLSCTFAAQIVMCECLPNLTRTTSLTRTEWGACIAVGATPLAISIILKLTPEAWLSRVADATKGINEDQASESRVLNAWQKSAKQQPNKQGGTKQEANGDNDNFNALKQ